MEYVISRPPVTANDYLELIRAPAALTVLGDTAVGAIWSGAPLTGPRVALPVASALLYSSGMALNDYADRERDAVERPERPIPSGRVSPGAALSIAAVLAAAGAATAAAVGGRHSLVAAGRVTLCVAAYDFVAKDTVVGPLVMAGCRFLDVLLGAAGGRPTPWLAASVVGLHTTAVTVLSRREVTGSSPGVPAVVGGLAAVVLASSTAASAGKRWYRPVPAAAVYLWSFGPSLYASWRQPSAETIRAAVRSGIVSTVGVQAILAARARSARTTVALAGLAMWLRLKVSGSRPAEVT